MLETLRNLLREVLAIISVVQGSPRDQGVGNSLVLRIQDLASTWSISVRPGLTTIGVPKEVVDRADRLIAEAARLHPGPSSRLRFLVSLSSVLHVLRDQVLLEVARIPPGAQAAALAVSASGAQQYLLPEPIFPEISDLPNQLVPNALQGWAKPIRQFLRSNPFGKNVFVMVSYRAALAPMIRQVKGELVRLALNPVVAREHDLTDDLYNPVACLLCCSYGVAIFDRAEATQRHNPNVIYELGMMQLLKRPCVILKNRRLRRMPSDLLAKLYQDYSTTQEATHRLREWWERRIAE